jgi:hypothetical protein
VAEAGALGAGAASKVALDAARLLEGVGLDDMDDPLWPLRDVSDFGLARRRLPLPRMRTADIHPTRLHPRDACPRKHCVAVELALSEGQHVEPGGAGSERVRLPLG